MTIIRSSIRSYGNVLGAALALCATAITGGCADPGQVRAEQRADDQQRCSDYGYAPGTDAFADCMMHRTDRREARQDREQSRKERIRQQALDRSGDERFPICSAANMDAELDTAGNFWYAEGCRAR